MSWFNLEKHQTICFLYQWEIYYKNRCKPVNQKYLLSNVIFVDGKW